MTCHASDDNMSQDPPPLSLELLDGSPIKLTDSYATVPYADGYGGGITLHLIENGSGRPRFGQNDDSGASEINWL